MKLYQDVYEQLLFAFPIVPPETGAILGSADGMTVSDFVIDNHIPDQNRAVYTPNTAFLNKQIAMWAERGIDFCGLLHTHPVGNKRLSSMDKQYIAQIMSQFGEKTKLFFPIIFPFQKMISFVAVGGRKGVIIRQDKIQIIDRRWKNGKEAE